jgi:hypothetical protein
MTAESDLVIAAARIARSSPDAWDQFLASVQAYSSQQIQNCIQSPLELLPVSQGRAQATARLYGILAECKASADKLEGKRK